jgi:hypothetical protein
MRLKISFKNVPDKLFIITPRELWFKLIRKNLFHSVDLEETEMVGNPSNVPDTGAHVINSGGC